MNKLFYLILLSIFVISIQAKPIAFIQDQELLNRLIDLSAPNSIQSMEDLDENVAEIKSIFGDQDDLRGFVDPRGAFATIYQVTTSKGLASILETENGQGEFHDPAMVRCFAVEFGKLYLDNLHGHLTGGPVSKGWRSYYRMAADKDMHILQIMGAGANVHINIDLTAALQTCEASKDFKDDFMQAGKPLVEEIPTMAEDLKAIYGVDHKLTYALFNMYFVGAAGNVIFKLFGMEKGSSYAIFQTLRWLGFKNHKILTRLHDGKWYTIAPHAREALLRKRMDTLWGASNFVLNKWIHIAQNESIDRAEDQLDNIFKDVIKNIGRNFFKRGEQEGTSSLIDLDPTPDNRLIDLDNL
ncbi:MAG: hypothetical protein KC646_05000 [Candidatus Cloacimonetes bacterium]|nr:hypothetical protein [Candidatus Cloacimonadota bacterium]